MKKTLKVFCKQPTTILRGGVRKKVHISNFQGLTIEIKHFFIPFSSNFTQIFAIKRKHSLVYKFNISMMLANLMEQYFPPVYYSIWCLVRIVLLSWLKIEISVSLIPPLIWRTF